MNLIIKTYVWTTLTTAFFVVLAVLYFAHIDDGRITITIENNKPEITETK